MKPAILLVEDEPASRFGFVRYFGKEGYDVAEAANLAEAQHALSSSRFDAVVLDINLPDGNGIDFIDTVREVDTCIPIIVITGSGDIPLAVEAMRRGADNFLTKPVDNAGLAMYLKKILEIGALKRQNVARQRLERKDDIFFGTSAEMAKIVEVARLAASGDSPVLVTGETGTGKGMLAKWIHRNSRRSLNECVEVNCSGLRGELLAREIFGNARGAFTSADQDRKGLLDIAHRGTLFLDEIGDMNLEVQAQFLKVLEEKSYRRLGDVRLLKSDFRLICATNRDIGSLIGQGCFRQDLLYRINLITIHLPPLKSRQEDLPALISYLMRRSGAKDVVVGPAVLRMLQQYHWPGNVRELKNVLERALILSRGGELKPEHFDGMRNSADPEPGRQRSMEEVEKEHILRVLEQVGGNINEASRALSISRATLYRKLKQIKEP